MSDAVFKCPHCGQMFKGSKDDVGAEAECSSCGKAFTLEVFDDSVGRQLNPFMCFLGVYRKFFGFNGRMRRREFWWAFFFLWMGYILSFVVDVTIWGSANWCFFAFSLGSIIPLVAAQIRRLHDTNKSGWWVPMILLCPINIAYFVWLATDGDKGQNRFGLDPKGR